MGAQDIPKKPPIHMDEEMTRPKEKRPPIVTFRELLTEKESMPKIVKFFSDMATQKRGKWENDWDFFVANATGDVSTMKPEVKKRVDAIIKNVQEEYIK